VTELKPLTLKPAEVEAQRLYYITEAARHMADDAGMLAALHELGERFPESQWRLKALITVGNRYLVTHDREQYVTMFRAAAETFAGNPAASTPHWKVTWDAWLSKRPERMT